MAWAFICNLVLLFIMNKIMDGIKNQCYTGSYRLQ